MAKKIVILTGSPRKNGNTAALTTAFKKGAEEAGHTVTEFFLNGMDIQGCLGCWQGGKDPEHPCVQTDDMLKIYPSKSFSWVITPLEWRSREFGHF